MVNYYNVDANDSIILVFFFCFTGKSKAILNPSDKEICILKYKR